MNIVGNKSNLPIQQPAYILKMNKKEAIEIISMIANGLDPYGEGNSTENLPEINPVTIRALCTAITLSINRKDKEYLTSRYKTKKLKNLIKMVSGPLEDFLKEKEKEEVIEAFGKANFDFEKAAEILEIETEELEHKLIVYNLNEIQPRILLKNVKKDFINIIKNSSLGLYLKIIERNAIKKVLDDTEDNRSEAAKILGVKLRSLRYRIEEKAIFNSNDRYPDKNLVTDYFNFSKHFTLDEFLEKVEMEILKMTLEETDFDKTKASKLLGINIRSLRYKIEKYKFEFE